MALEAVTHRNEPFINQFEGLVQKAESVYAYPPKMPQLWSQHRCGNCMEKDTRDKDVRLHIVLQPRGLMSTTFASEGDYSEIRAWDVALAPPLYRPLFRQDPTPPKALALWTEYKDYYPETYVGGGIDYRDRKQSHLVGAKQGGKKKKKETARNVPTNIQQGRCHWPTLEALRLSKRAN